MTITKQIMAAMITISFMSTLLGVVVSSVSGGGMDGCMDGCMVGEHTPSLRDEVTTGHCGSTIISSPATLILAPPLSIQSSIRETSWRLST